MRAETFFDTNILLYSVTPGDPRSVVALQLLDHGGRVSVQVLNEFVNVARRKMKLDWQDIEESLRSFEDLLGPPVENTSDQQKAAVIIATAYGYNIFDAMVIASTLASGCRILYTEDVQHGQVVSGVRITNPFLR